MQVSAAPTLTWIKAAKLACAGLTTKQQRASNCRAVCGFLRGETPWSASDKFVRVVDPSSLYAAGRTCQHAMTGVKPGREDKIPLPDGYSLWKLGLKAGSLNSFLWQYVGHAITIAFAAANGGVPAVMRVTTTQNVVCMILCAATPQPFCTLLPSDPFHSRLPFTPPLAIETRA